MGNNAAGQTAEWHASSLHPDVPAGGVDCTITRVERYAP
jgi:hypothetical protein